jgi:hypothetical protein
MRNAIEEEVRRQVNAAISADKPASTSDARMRFDQLMRYVEGIESIGAEVEVTVDISLKVKVCP